MKIVTQGHYEPNKQALNEAWGLDILEQGDMTRIVTSSDDGTCRLFDPVAKVQTDIFNLAVDAAG